MKMKLFYGMLTVLALLFAPGCDAAEKAAIPGGSPKILIAVFSYSGNTRQVAQAIQRKTGGTLIEIEPETPYSKDYQAVVQQGREEVNANFLPKLKTKVPDIRDYDVIFIGSPNWWNTMAPPVATFLSRHDFAGKTLVPFTTHGGSGLGHYPEDMKKLCPQALLLEGATFSRDRIAESGGEVAQWVRKIMPPVPAGQ